MNICQEEGCQETDTVECYLTMYKGDFPFLSYVKMYGLIEAIRIQIDLLQHGYADTYDYYCAKHCKKNGYCYGCGHFWAGSESFDFGNGLCSNCRGDLGEYEYDDDDQYYYRSEEYYAENDYPEDYQDDNSDR